MFKNKIVFKLGNPQYVSKDKVGLKIILLNKIKFILLRFINKIKLSYRINFLKPMFISYSNLASLELMLLKNSGIDEKNFLYFTYKENFTKFFLEHNSRFKLCLEEISKRNNNDKFMFNDNLISVYKKYDEFLLSRKINYNTIVNEPQNSITDRLSLSNIEEILNASLPTATSHLPDIILVNLNKVINLYLHSPLVKPVVFFILLSLILQKLIIPFIKNFVIPFIKNFVIPFIYCLYNYNDKYAIENYFSEESIIAVGRLFIDVKNKISAIDEFFLGDIFRDYLEEFAIDVYYFINDTSIAKIVVVLIDDFKDISEKLFLFFFSTPKSTAITYIVYNFFFFYEIWNYYENNPKYQNNHDYNLKCEKEKKNLPNNNLNKKN